MKKQHDERSNGRVIRNSTITIKVLTVRARLIKLCGEVELMDFNCQLLTMC